MTLAEVRLWGRRIGAVSWDPDRSLSFFEYESRFLASGVELAPLTMPLGPQIYSFPGLARQTFFGLPGLLADSLPDRFGNALIDAWLETQGRSPESFNPVERLCYVGKRGMGALEFEPTLGPAERVAGKSLDVDALVRLAGEILSRREALRRSFRNDARREAMRDILRVGTSAGGARAKAIIAWNPDTDEVRSGQIEAGQGFSYWLLKFDGVTGNRDKELDDPLGFGLVEYAYHLMARAVGLEMSECRVLPEGNRHHFMTRRFDRTDGGGKLHMQSLGAMAHFDFNQAGAHSYEQALGVARQLGLPMRDREQLFRRMVFNLVARNQDDHVKNIAFLMDRAGRWSLAPAFDVTYSYNPRGTWTSSHQMTVNGKRDEFRLADLEACARTASMQRGLAAQVLAEVCDGVRRWAEFADAAGVPEALVRRIAKAHRLEAWGTA